MRAGLIMFGLLEAALRSAAACSLDTDAVAFGRIDVMRDSTAIGRIVLSCPIATTAAVMITSPADGSDRLMHSASNRVLRYKLYRDPSHVLAWGDGGSLGPGVGVTLLEGGRLELDVHAKVPSQPSTLPGDYSDQPIVTLIY